MTEEETIGRELAKVTPAPVAEAPRLVVKNTETGEEVPFSCVAVGDGDVILLHMPPSTPPFPEPDKWDLRLKVALELEKLGKRVCTFLMAEEWRVSTLTLDGARHLIQVLQRHIERVETARLGMAGLGKAGQGGARRDLARPGEARLGTTDGGTTERNNLDPRTETL